MSINVPSYLTAGTTDDKVREFILLCRAHYYNHLVGRKRINAALCLFSRKMRTEEQCIMLLRWIVELSTNQDSLVVGMMENAYCMN
eukprot:scaffold6795_cov110-Cylindrotheca_fusiformis.AAC.1